jgi:hypothetical protein
MILHDDAINRNPTTWDHEDSIAWLHILNRRVQKVARAAA